MVLLFCVLIGLAIGSFLNVCISRIPLDESVVHPRSRCPQCRKPIGNRDNIPILSYILLGGKCRHCRKKIPVRYPIIEAITGIVGGLLYFEFGLGFAWVVYLLFCAALIALAVIDADHRILPDLITLNGLWIGLVMSLFLLPPGTVLQPIPGEPNLGFAFRLTDGVLRLIGFADPSPVLVSVVSSLTGAIVGGGLLWAVREAYFRFRGVEGMGFGDVKMMAMVGAFIGIPLTLFTILIGSILGSVIGLLMMKFGGKDKGYELPFGTFLSLGAILAVLSGNKLIAIYLSSMRP